MVYMNWDRLLMLKFTPLTNLVETYRQKPQPSKRAVLVLACHTGVCMDTIKTLLDQSIRVHDIAIQTTNENLFPPELKRFCTFHPPNSQAIREGEQDTTIIHIQNGKLYDYDAIETTLEKLGGL